MITQSLKHTSIPAYSHGIFYDIYGIKHFSLSQNFLYHIERTTLKLGINLPFVFSSFVYTAQHLSPPQLGEFFNITYFHVALKCGLLS